MAKLIFISCGQRTRKERAIGFALKKLIDSKDGFKAFFAEETADVSPLTTDIFQNLAQCSGAIFILHPREYIGRGKRRASLWIEQEIAILAFLRDRENLRVPVLSFKDPKVKLDGVSSSLILNARATLNSREILQAVDEWLLAKAFVERPATLLGRLDMLLEVARWRKDKIDYHEKFFCERDDSFNLVVGQAGELFHESWVNHLVNKTATVHSVHLNYRDHTLEQLPFVRCDGGRLDLPMPEISSSGKFFYVRASRQFKVGRILGVANGKDGWNLEDIARIIGVEIH